VYDRWSVFEEIQWDQLSFCERVGWDHIYGRHDTTIYTAGLVCCGIGLLLGGNRRGEVISDRGCG